MKTVSKVALEPVHFLFVLRPVMVWLRRIVVSDRCYTRRLKLIQ